ncbi:MAG: substrate-binding domain-containing protein, partial [Actinomycetota bacterium]
GEAEALDSLINLQADGLVLCGPRLPNETLAEYTVRTPIVGISIFGEPSYLDTVCNHEAHGAQLAVDHLLELGHERIAHIHAAPAAGGPERRTGFIDAMVNRGLAPILVEGDFTEEAGANGADQLLSLREPPTAILAGNDLAAVGVLGRLTALGVRVPEDVSVVGYDDTLLASISATSLTTVHQPRQVIGRRSLELLVERMQGRTEAVHELVEPWLVTRSSTGPVPG